MSVRCIGWKAWAGASHPLQLRRPMSIKSAKARFIATRPEVAFHLVQNSGANVSGANKKVAIRPAGNKRADKAGSL